MSDFGGPTWKPKSVDDAVAKEELAAVHPTGHWKKMYFRTIAGQELSKWRRTLRDISPSTGLPGQTKWILRYGCRMHSHVKSMLLDASGCFILHIL